MALLATLLAGSFFVLGALVAWRFRGVQSMSVYSMAIAFGSLACVAGFDMVPEALEAVEEQGLPLALLLIALGAGVLVLLDRLVPDHHAGGEAQGHEHGHGADEEEVAHIGNMAIVAVSVHNLAEGAAIFTLGTMNLASGLVMALGVGFHNAPMGMLIYSSIEQDRGRGIAMLTMAALSTFIGGLAVFLLGNALTEAMELGVLCVALGMIGYILFAELLPSMVRTGDVKRNLIGVAIGAIIVLIGLQLG